MPITVLEAVHLHKRSIVVCQTQGEDARDLLNPPSIVGVDVGRPVGDAAVELGRRQTGHLGDVG
ncbi:MAG TPA: hypothetical protein PK954_14470, partial [Anaerolineales bacterium]|nr:hypothetical protein [Anaerolineales bacterium]